MPNQTLEERVNLLETEVARLRALLTTKGDGSAGSKPESLPVSRVTALLSEQSLSRIWNSPEEDEAWKDL